ncbi:acyl-CoA dehydrogenase family protein [Roseitranquillus sediminis]|uniref:acyl-CoA dehydrogenase family protein n=1 Tax=Roseitranquillus sediminis TaxID=2809051 RepID=UPI001D0C4B0B|nr:acyl-CoA dehydrogenase family protein [Roseitranquillus sediminis]MBM9596241.1 acyl-CoA/acyl-ACP dehydrogenase [Roseitranquillus sediminis]
MQRVIESAAARVAELSPPGEDEPPMAPLIAVLRGEGLLQSCAPSDAGGQGLAHHPDEPHVLLEALAAVGGANLSVGRLFEGHVNAVKLVALLATGPARRRWLTDAANGRLFGVWGADGPVPVTLEGERLRGQKLYASGADLLDRAVVTARDPAGEVVLIVLPAERLQGRLHPGEWSMTGMQATASGRCDLEGVEVNACDRLGAPGDYLREPHFQGGVWRYAAVQLGAMRTILGAAVDQLRRRGHEAAPLQVARLRRMTVACETARLWLTSAAREVEQPGAPPSAAAASILARLVVADEATALLAAADAALGAASFSTSHPVERVRRDLLVYLRQANPDALESAAMATLLGDDCLARRWRLA